jgi:LysR family transcriptional regulator, hydrogen peroxide-inducible genes activator
MTLSQLEYALSIQKSGSFSKSAKNLSLSQPALSAQIQKLESEIGLKLFDRSSTPMSTTEDGRAFLLRAQEIVASSARLLSFSKELLSNFSATLKIGIIPTLSPFLVPLFSQSLHHDFPNFKLDITEMITEKIVSQVRGGILDAGIISTPISSYGINSEALFYEKFYLYSSKELNGTVLNVSDINENDLWMLDEGNCFRDQVNDFCQLKAQREQKQIVYRCNSIDSLIRMVDNHGGLTILPELTTISLNETQEMNISPIPKKAREIGLITRTVADKERYLDVLKKYILDNVPKHMLTATGLEIVDPGVDLKE